MDPTRVERKLTAILSADVQGYSRLMGEDEVATIRTLTAYRELMVSRIQQHRGRVVDTVGDNLLADFGSVVDAVTCAVEVQRELGERNAELPDQRKMEFRIGINLGDVVVDGERIYGDGVNIAARVEGMAEGGGICVSGTVYDQIERKLALGYESLGEHNVKNIDRPVRMYRVRTEPGNVAAMGRSGRTMGLRHWQRTALAVVAILVVGAGARAMWNFYLRGPTTPVEVASKDRMNFPLPEKPSIAVLPFVNMSGDPEQEYFSDGITEDLITDISKLSGVFVIARNSTFIYKGRPVKIQQVAEEFGVRYVLKGSVRKAEQRVRITAQLVDALTGHQLWAERYDRDLTNVFALQDEIVQKIVDALAVELTEGERGRVVRKATDNPEAYDYFLRGQGYFWRTTKEANTRARRMYEKATELDPEYAEPYAALGFTYFQQWALLWSQDPQTLKQAFEFVQQAIALNDSLSMAHNILGKVYLWQKQHELAIAEGERAIALAPNDAEGYAALGDILAWSGRPEEAIKLVKKAMRLNPRYPFIYLWTLGHAYYLTEQYEEAIAALKRLLTHNPDYMPAHAYLASMYGEFGRKDKAQAEGAEVRRLSPQISLESLQKRLPYKSEVALERSLDGFRKAGLK